MKYTTFNDYVKAYLAIKKNELSTMSYHHYDGLIHKHIIPYFNDLKVEDINKEVLIQFFDQLMLEDSSKNVLRSIMKSIIDTIDDLDSAALLSVLVQTSNSKEKLVLSKMEEKLIRDYCVSHFNEYTLSILLALYCGLKIAEICALKVDDVYGDHTLHIHMQMQRLPNNDDHRKTRLVLLELEEYANRNIPIPDFLYDLIHSYNNQKGTFLLSKKVECKGARIYQIQVKQIIQDIGIEFNYNVLRETFKQRCVESNMNVYKVMKILGVSSISFYMKDQYR